jgi:predicted anti-sigma-YlaC factor YlaD
MCLTARLMLVKTPRGSSALDEHLGCCPTCRHAMAFNTIAAGPPEWLEQYFAAGGVRPSDASVMVDGLGASE